MAAHKLELGVCITEMKVPLMIIVDTNKNVIVYENGVKVENMKDITFSASVEELPLLTITKYPVI